MNYIEIGGIVLISAIIGAYLYELLTRRICANNDLLEELSNTVQSAKDRLTFTVCEKKLVGKEAKLIVLEAKLQEAVKKHNDFLTEKRKDVQYIKDEEGKIKRKQKSEMRDWEKNNKKPEDENGNYTGM